MSFKKHVVEERVASGLTAEAVTRFYQALDCPRALTAEILHRYGEFDQLVSLTANPLDYNSPESFRDAYLASNLLVKSSFLKTTFNKEELALTKFLKFEELCKQTNTRWNPFNHGNFTFHDSSLISQVRRKIERILGAFDPDEMLDLASWGPGVSTSVKGEETFAAKKFQCETGITRDLLPLVKDLFPLAYPKWWEVLNENKDFPKLEIGNVVVTVPKTSKINRVIAIEPGINLWFQMGIGRMIRRRLGRFGIDLTDQTRNQRLAFSSSKKDDLVTVDFSSASDSISFELVRDLFSLERSSYWFNVMDVTRSKYGVAKGKTFRWNKFSSMGNGFTFDLETLIFYALACVCCEADHVSIEDVSVYGDDVVIPVSAYTTFVRLSSLMGFSVNSEKSFSHGYFRESCGSHYYNGVNCKPIYLEDKLDSFQKVYTFANGIRLLSKLPFGCDDRFRTLFYTLQKAIPKKFRWKVSATYNAKSKTYEPLEGGFISNFDEACPSRLKHGIEGYRVRRFAWLAVKVDIDYCGLLLSRLKSPSVDSENGNSVPLRNRTRRHVVTTVISQWVDLGPWI